MGLAVLKQSSRCPNPSRLARWGSSFHALGRGCAAELARRGPRRLRPRVTRESSRSAVAAVLAGATPREDAAHRVWSLRGQESKAGEARPSAFQWSFARRSCRFPEKSVGSSGRLPRSLALVAAPDPAAAGSAPSRPAQRTRTPRTAPVPRRSGFDGLRWRSRIGQVSRHPRAQPPRAMPRALPGRSTRHAEPHRARPGGFAQREDYLSTAWPLGEPARGASRSLHRRIEQPIIFSAPRY